MGSFDRQESREILRRCFSIDLKREHLSGASSFRKQCLKGERELRREGFDGKKEERGSSTRRTLLRHWSLYIGNQSIVQKSSGRNKRVSESHAGAVRSSTRYRERERLQGTHCAVRMPHNSLCSRANGERLPFQGVSSTSHRVALGLETENPWIAQTTETESRFLFRLRHWEENGPGS